MPALKMRTSVALKFAFIRVYLRFILSLTLIYRNQMVLQNP